MAKPIPASTPFGKGIAQMVDRLGGKTEPEQEKGFVAFRLAGVVFQDL